MFIQAMLNVIIICCSTILGNRIANIYAYRVKQLRMMQICIAKLETEIVFYSTFLPEALLNVGKSISGGIGEFLCDVSTNLTDRNSADIESAWELALSRNKSKLRMTYEDYEVLNRFGSQLGMADRDSQKQLFELTQKQLQKQEKRAEEDRDRYEKMYRSLGFLSGLTIVIILF